MFAYNKHVERAVIQEINAVMEKEQHKDNWLELNLNFITALEESKADTFSEYRKNLLVYIQLKDLYLTEDQLLERCKDSFGAESIDKILETYPLIIPSGGIRKDKTTGEVAHLYIDLAPVYFIQPKDMFYDFFFACRIRHIDLLKIDEFLEYHYSHYYEDNLVEFSRFLRVLNRKYQDKLLNSDQIQTMTEWLELKEKEVQQLQSIAGVANRSKGKLKRDASDNLTCLNQEQTVLLIYFLQKQRVFLKDEYLTAVEAGRAFEILTGYSQNTLRMNLSKYLLLQNKENLTALDTILSQLKTSVKEALKEV
jgi:hypothetical protein